MAHEVETMAYAGQLPWHGLGTRVEDLITVDEMIKAAGLDWEVTQHEVYSDIGGEKIVLPRKALVRSSDNKIMDISGEDWKPLQNKDALGFFKEYAEAGGIKLETAGSLRGGKVIWGLANIQKGFSLMNGRDKVEGYILMISPHEVGKAISVRSTSVRVVCANTLAMAINGKSSVEYRQSHMKDFNFEKAKETVNLVSDQIGMFEAEAKKLLKLKMSDFDTVKVLAKFFQPADGEMSKREADNFVSSLINGEVEQNKNMANVMLSLVKAPGATPGNGWGVLNAVTHWADHVAGREADARLYRSWLGHTGGYKQKVKDELMLMAA